MADATVTIRGGAGNAVQIQGRAVPDIAPTSGQALAWDSGDSAWEPQTISGGGSSEWTDTGSVLHPTEHTVDNVVVGGTTTANSDIVLGVDGAAVFNEQGADVDFRIEASGEANALVVQGSDGFVGIGVAAPNADLHVNGSSPVIAIGSSSASDPRLDFYDQGTTNIGASIFLDQNLDDLKILRTASGSATDGIVIDGSGNIGLGELTPGERLAVDGALALKEQASSASATAAYAKIYTEEYGNDANTKLLLHMDGADDGTSFTDSSASSQGITRYNAVTKTGVKKFGTASGYFDGTGDYLAITADASLTLDADFCVEYWAYMTASETNSAQICSANYYTAGKNGNWYVAIRDDRVTFASFDGTGTNESVSKTGMSNDLNRWYHVACVRSGTILKLFLDGIEQASGTVTKSLVDGSDGGLEIGRLTSYGDHTGYIDELTIVKGEAVHAANFTPARSAFPVTNIVIVDDNGGEYKLGRNW